MSAKGEDIPLKSVSCKVISMAGARRRRRFTKRMFYHMETPFDFVDGIEDPRKIRACILAHRQAHDAAAGALPYAIFEDDLEFVWDAPVLKAPPADADIIYLGTNTAGCFPRDPRFHKVFGHRSVEKFALAEAYDDTYLRLYSMVSAHAVLFLTERGQQTYRAALDQALRRHIPLDVMYAYAMPDLNVYAVREPMFREDEELQPRSKRSPSRLAITSTPLTPAKPGDRRKGEKKRWFITAEVTRNAQNGLEWDLVSYEERPRG